MTHPHLSPDTEWDHKCETPDCCYFGQPSGHCGCHQTRDQMLKREVARLRAAIPAPAQIRQEPVEWHWRVLEDNGHPASKWFVVDGDVEEFKRDMASDPYEIRPLYTAPAQWMQVPKPWAYYVEHKMFGVELSLDQPSEDAERRGWVGKRTAGVTPGPSEDLLCEMCSESVEGAHHPECMYHVDQARTFVPAQSPIEPQAWRWKVSPLQLNWQYSDAPPATFPVYNLELLYANPVQSAQPVAWEATDADLNANATLTRDSVVADIWRKAGLTVRELFAK